MKFGVVIFPGSNCDTDIIHVLKNVMQQEVVELWHKNTSLKNLTTQDCIILPGGFSYGDYLRCGAIARFSPIMQGVIDFAGKGGFVMGICNGFQILCESHLLPGALLRNVNQKFICKNVLIKAQNNESRWTADIDLSRPLKIPIAHADGRYYADKNVLEKMNKNGQILFRYCDEQSYITPESNPNGSLENIAGICNESKNVFGMMPHPERASENILGNEDGKMIFESLLMQVNS